MVLLVFLFFLFHSLHPTPTLSLDQQGLFLLQFKRHLSDPSNSLSSWNLSDPTPCRWRGVTCHPLTSAVTALDLSDTAVAGQLPAVPLCRLPHLASLNLAYNSISDEIPPSLAACRRLRHLDLSQNLLVGPLPSFISNLTSLRYLDLSANNLSGEIPANLGALPNLETLILSSNFLNGTIPGSLSNISSLKLLNLAYNPFASRLPSQLGGLANLEDLSLAGCDFVGPIPDSFGNLTRLVNLDLSRNALAGRIPESFAGLRSASQIELYNNSLSGALPRGLANLTRLRNFDASSNQLTGTIPEGLCDLPLASLNLFENNLEGTLPASIARSPNLYELKIFNNSLVGNLPRDLGSNSPLQRLDVSFNRFSGEIPANLCRRVRLQEVILMYNSFSGRIPESLGNCTSLRRVRIRNNNLSGTVPDGFWALPRVSLLELVHNNLSGPISNSISGARNLSSLLVSNNRFSGPIPDGIGMLGSLLEIHAGSNRLSGRIPDSMAKLIELGFLDLGDNGLSGEIPRWIGGWTKLNELILAHNKFGGEIPKELGNLSVLTYLDLSSNNLSGEIPKELQKLRLSVFNLSYNSLSGEVPPLYDNGNYKMDFVGNPGLCVMGTGKNCHGSGHNKYRNYAWIFESIFALAAVVFFIGIAWFCFKYRKFKKLNKSFNAMKWKSFHKLSFNELDIVKLMSEENVIGSGASGKVYKVALSSGEVVAVKKLWGTTTNRGNGAGAGTETADDGSSRDEFDVEVETLGKIRHKNIVRLWCCCNSGDSKLLVYEYMPNGNLADMLKCSKKSLLGWPARRKIAIDAAEGLAYLHHDCVPAIVHRDVKSSNILLDAEFGAKVADFGVSKIIKRANQGTESMSVIAGSYGYIAPEYAYTLRVNEKSDIYSFGVVILELVTGKPPIDAEYGENDLVKWVSTTLEQNGLDHVIDPTLDPKYKEEISKVLSVGLLCTTLLPISRPAMRKVVKMLQEAAAGRESARVQEGKLSPYYHEETSNHNHASEV